mgnify:FL=1
MQFCLHADGCPLDNTCDDKYVWSETEIGTVDTSYSCIQRRCGGTYSTGGQWEPVVFACASEYASCALQEWEDLLAGALINTEVSACKNQLLANTFSFCYNTGCNYSSERN